MTHPIILFPSVSPSSPMHTDGDPRGPVPAPSSPEGGRSPAQPSASAASGGQGRGRRVSRAWEAIPSYRPGQERVAVVPKRNVIRDARDVWLATADIHEARQEHVLVFDLDVRHRVVARRVVAIGSVSGVDVHPREVFRPAIANAAAAILLVHNHPSGEEQPSSQDREITARLRDAGQLRNPTPRPRGGVRRRVSLSHPVDHLRGCRTGSRGRRGDHQASTPPLSLPNRLSTLRNGSSPAEIIALRISRMRAIPSAKGMTNWYCANPRRP
jgi:hypothetical protein